MTKTAGKHRLDINACEMGPKGKCHAQEDWTCDNTQGQGQKRAILRITTKYTRRRLRNCTENKTPSAFLSPIIQSISWPPKISIAHPACKVSQIRLRRLHSGRSERWGRREMRRESKRVVSFSCLFPLLNWKHFIFWWFFAHYCR